jgi:hypothetical protein
MIDNQMNSLLVRCPDHVEIGGINYEVGFVENLANDGTLCDGHIEYNEAQISISTAQVEQMRIATFFHEAIHAIVTQACRGKEITEEMIETIAFGLAGMKVR